MIYTKCKSIGNIYREIVVGDPRLITTQMGALISKEHLAKVQGYVTLAREEGAVIQRGHELKLPAELEKVQHIAKYYNYNNTLYSIFNNRKIVLL